MSESYGNRMRQALASRQIVPFIGVYDVFSASIAARYYDALFLSGFGFAASHYGLPDMGYIAWSDVADYVRRIRTVLPAHHLLVDIDDGYCDTGVACHVVSVLEALGASGVVLEDQQRPRRCGHFDGKQVMALEPFVDKLREVLATRNDLFVIARTDARDEDEILRRVRAFTEAGADAVLVDGLRDLETLSALKRAVSETGCLLTFNQIAGGKSPPCDLNELASIGASVVIYSTPCLFAAQAAMEEAMRELRGRNGLLPSIEEGGVGVSSCTAVLEDNLRSSGGGRLGPTGVSAPRLDGDGLTREAR